MLNRFENKHVFKKKKKNSVIITEITFGDQRDIIIYYFIMLHTIIIYNLICKQSKARDIYYNYTRFYARYDKYNMIYSF